MLNVKQQREYAGRAKPEGTLAELARFESDVHPRVWANLRSLCKQLDDALERDDQIQIDNYTKSIMGCLEHSGIAGKIFR